MLTPAADDCNSSGRWRSLVVMLLICDMYQLHGRLLSGWHTLKGSVCRYSFDEGNDMLYSVELVLLRLLHDASCQLLTAEKPYLLEPLLHLEALKPRILHLVDCC